MLNKTIQTSSELIPSGKITHLVVLLHGYGANGEDLIELAYPWQNYLEGTAFLAPNAPTKMSQSAFGYEWFDLSDYPSTDMQKGLKGVRSDVKTYLEESLRRFEIPASNLILVGFSQGTMVALDQLYALEGLGGIVGFSGAFFPHKEKIMSQCPILLVHGTDDTIVSYSSLENASQTLESLHVPVQQKTCNGLGHGIDAEGAYEALHFISNIFTQSQPLASISSV